MFAVSFPIENRKRNLEFCFNIENTMPTGATAMTFGGLFVNGYPATTPFDTPTTIICSLAEAEAATPSTELQAYKNMGVN